MEKRPSGETAPSNFDRKRKKRMYRQTKTSRTVYRSCGVSKRKKNFFFTIFKKKRKIILKKAESKKKKRNSAEKRKIDIPAQYNFLGTLQQWHEARQNPTHLMLPKSVFAILSYAYIFTYVSSLKNQMGVGSSNDYISTTHQTSWSSTENQG